LAGVFWKRLAANWHRRGLDDCFAIERAAEENDNLMYPGEDQKTWRWYKTVMRAEGGESMTEERSVVYHLAHNVFGVPTNPYFFKNTRDVRYYHLWSLRDLGCELTETEGKVLNYLENEKHTYHGY
jgi:hypothetical protein